MLTCRGASARAHGKAPPGRRGPKRGGVCAICYALHAACLVPRVHVVCRALLSRHEAAGV